MYKIKGSIWIENDNGAFIGSGRILLLEKIKKFGSITLAARSMKMSYRQAWELINSMNKQAKYPLVETSSGGAGGGGTKITTKGEEAIKFFKDLQDKFHKFNEDETQKLKF